MKKSHKAILYNFLGFAPVFLLVYYLVLEFTGLIGFWPPLVSFVSATLLCPKFQAIKQLGEEKIFMSWLFIKGVKEVK
jgi:hypothetical protein